MDQDIKVKANASLSSKNRSFNLKNCDLELSAGKAYALVGNSGSGKTTLLSALSGILGTRKFDGVTPTIGFVSHQSITPKWISLRKAIALEAKLRNLSFDHDKFLRLINSFGLPPSILESRSWELSHGMRQRFEIAKSLAFRVDLLLLDEGLSGIHAAAKHLVIEELHLDLQKKNMTLLFITHDIFDVARLADKFSVIDNGQLYQPNDLSSYRSIRHKQDSIELLTTVEEIMIKMDIASK